MGITLLIPGQGNQHPRMFAPLAASREAMLALESANDYLGVDLRHEVAARTDVRLYENRFAQPLLCAAIFAAWQGLRPYLPTPDLVLGYSVGELAAYGVAGSLPLVDLLHLARCRADAMELASGAADGGSGLLAIRGQNEAAVTALCARFRLEIAAINGADHFVVGGNNRDLEIASAALKQNRIVSRRLDVRVASHTSLLHSAAGIFGAQLQRAPFQNPLYPLLGAVDACVIRDRHAGKRTLVAQLYRPLAWTACMSTALALGGEIFLEVGPGQTLTRLLRAAHPHVRARSIDEFAQLDAAVEWVLREQERGARTAENVTLIQDATTRSLRLKTSRCW